MTNEEFMRLAIEEAKRGIGFVNPNPLVGAVIVKNGRIIGKGAHLRYGSLHAERNALAACSESTDGADMYVTLEPCCHYGKNPPCTEAVIASGIRRVFVGSSDPNPLVAGKGIQRLKAARIRVTEGVLKDECDALNSIFFHYITSKTPFVTMKYAMSADGKIAAYTGSSKWITGEEARLDVQHERLRHSAIMVGVGTVIADDPSLTCRLEGGRNPIRIICDSNLRIPPDCGIVRTAKDVPTIIACCESADIAKMNRLEKQYGCKIIAVKSENDRVDLRELMRKLGEQGIDSILLEGGSELNWSALSSGIVNRVLGYIAPKLIGGNNAKSPIGGIGAPAPDDGWQLADTKLRTIGNDILMESRVIYDVHGDR